MKDSTKSTLVVASFIMSAISMFYSMTGQMELERSHGNIVRDTSTAIAKFESDQKRKNDAFVDFSTHFGNDVMNLTGRVAVLEAKNIARGD